MSIKKFDSKKVRNGVIAEASSSLISYPLSTIKTNRQIGKTISTASPVKLYKGVGWSLTADSLAAVAFYTLFEGMPQLQDLNPFVRSFLAATVSTTVAHPFSTIRKNIQVGKTIKNVTLKTMTKGYKVHLMNTIPGVSTNFTIRHVVRPLVPPWGRPCVGIFSSACSLILTHPLDTFATRVITNNKISFRKCLNFSGFKERFTEKMITLGSKMVILDNLDK